MTTITSVIIGFSGAIIGIVFGENLKSKAIRRIINVFIYESIAAFAILLAVYFSLLVWGLNRCFKVRYAYSDFFDMHFFFLLDKRFLQNG